MKSVCTSSCSFNSERGFCIICGLLVEELDNWDLLNEVEQKKVISDARFRVEKEKEPRKPYRTHE